MRKNVLSPHSEELPSLELLEEAEFFDVVERITLNQPITKSDELNWTLLQVQSDTFCRKGVVLLLISIMILAHLQVIRITFVIRIKIDEH